jgi:hypothetical protein
MALSHNDKYERGEEVRRKMRGKKKLRGRNLQPFYQKHIFWPQFCDVVGSYANFFNLIFLFLTMGICNTIILFSKYFSQNGKISPPRKKKKKKKKPSEKGKNSYFH